MVKKVCENCKNVAIEGRTAFYYYCRKKYKAVNLEDRCKEFVDKRK